MMVRRSNRKTRRWRFRAAILGVLACSASAIAEARPIDANPSVSPPSNLITGTTTSVAVQSGRAGFDLKVDQAGGQSLVIVSSLAQAPGPFPIAIKARPILDKPRPIVEETKPTVRSPSLDLPAVPAIGAATLKLPPTERTFHLMMQSGLATSPASYRAIPSRLRAVGRRVQIYVDAADQANVDVATLRDLVETFDARVWPKVAERFGPATDVDGDGRFTILLTGWLSRLADGKVRVDGFVRGADMDRRQAAPFGNRSDMMYLNANLKGGPHLRTVLAHEYTHSVTFSRKVLDQNLAGPLDASKEEDGWLDEALAHLVEDDLGFSRSNLDYRVSAFLSQPERYRLVVEDYYSADLFRSHGNRGATYLFLRWCLDRHGPKLLDHLIRSPKRGVANLEAATGLPFAELFRRWSVALYLSGLDPKSAIGGDYRSIDLRGELEDWVLAGPRTTVVEPGGPPHTWNAEGTSAHYVLVGRGAPGSIRVEVEGPPGAEVQVTVVSLPAALARPELVVRPWIVEDGSVRVRARVVEAGGTPVRLEALAWERLVPAADLHAPGFRHDALDRQEIASAFGSSTLPARGALRSRPILLPGVRPDDGPLVFKAVGVDARGRRVAAWAVVESNAPSDALARDDDPP